MTSQEHRDRAFALVSRAGRDETATPQMVQAECAAAQVHATLALYEGMYELLGDGSHIGFLMDSLRSRSLWR